MAVGVAALMIPVTSCAHRDGAEASPDAPARGVRADTPEKRHLLAAVRRYHGAFLTGAYERVLHMRDDLCRELSWEEALPKQVEQASRRYGQPQRIRSFRARIERHIAFVTYTFEDRRLDRHGEAWTLIKDGWRYADC